MSETLISKISIYNLILLIIIYNVLNMCNINNKISCNSIINEKIILHTYIL